MKQIERDLVIIGLIADYIGAFHKSIHEYIPSYDGEKINSLAEKTIKDDDHLEFILKTMANESYKRLSKKI